MPEKIYLPSPNKMWVLHICLGVRVFNTTFNCYIVASVLLVEETSVPKENHRPVTSHWQTLSHNVNIVSCTPHHERDSNSKL
jgi:gamma-glutamyl-gamma-aminobutyrate hydrolase PuuD